MGPLVLAPLNEHKAHLEALATPDNDFRDYYLDEIRKVTDTIEAPSRPFRENYKAESKDHEKPILSMKN